MNTYFTMLKAWFNRILGYFPTPLPQGLTEFEQWADSFSETYPLPTSSASDIRFVLTSEIMRLSPQTTSKPKIYFVRAMRAAAAKQVAGAVFHATKLQQMEAAKAAANPPTEATVTTLQVASDGQKQSSV